ncbi:unnamed protein product [Dovyalis caffra]|uniref:RING-type domain-containing protein n=1 Tax=Dovyalis caffra TaxID=77055 RepID=A0AAV1SKP2_9ROSI|nr:unnamed protein product [Dovyalis caffra]
MYDILAKITSHSASPMSVIVVEVCRTRNIVYDQKIMGDACRSVSSSNLFFDRLEYRKLDDFEIGEVVIAITFSIEVSPRSLTQVKPIADDEPWGLAPISAIVALRTISGCEMMEEMMDAMDLCHICPQEYSYGDPVVKTPCSHIFHGNCLTRWLSKAHNCPICRFKFPFQ